MIAFYEWRSPLTQQSVQLFVNSILTIPAESGLQPLEWEKTLNFMLPHMIKPTNIHSLTDFQRNAKSFVVQAKETKAPMVLTVNGRAELIVQDAQAYQELLDRLEYAESVIGILKSMEEFERGEGVPVKVAFEQLRRKHGLSA